MPPPTPKPRDPAALALLAAACLWFILAGLLFIPRIGVQQDEALFAAGIFFPVSVPFSIPALGGMPVMLMSYVGALKTCVYLVIFRLFDPGPYSLRVPVLLIGAATLPLFFLLLRRLVSDRWAAAGACLLASDGVYLLTSVCDWGPVAIQHILLLGGLLAGVRLWHGGRPLWGFVNGLLFGLALWDKAIFVWILAGLGVSLPLCYHAALWNLVRRRWVLPLAAAGFLLGSAPLLYYNERNEWQTIHQNANVGRTDVAHKLDILHRSIEGWAMFGYMIDDYPTPPPAAPHGALERASFGLSDALGNSQASFQFWGLVLAVLWIPFLKAGRRVALCLLLAASVALALMLGTVNAGGATHHHVMLWPLPQFLIVLALADLARRFRFPLAAVLAGVLCLSGVVVVNQYFRQLVQEGPAVMWTDAVYRLDVYLKDTRPAGLFIVDWGIHHPLRLLGAGTHRLIPGSDSVLKDMVSTPPQDLLTGIRNPDTVFVAHAAGAELFEGLNRKLRDVAAGIGYQKRLVATIHDAKAHPIFEVFRFEPVTAP